MSKVAVWKHTRESQKDTSLGFHICTQEEADRLIGAGLAQSVRAGAKQYKPLNPNFEGVEAAASAPAVDDAPLASSVDSGDASDAAPVVEPTPTLDGQDEPPVDTVPAKTSKAKK